jgi:hypothetical protein
MTDVIEVIADFMAGSGKGKDAAENDACALQDHLEEAGWVLRRRPTTAAELIGDERRRQIEVHGWTEEHDTETNRNAELARAAWSYLSDYLVQMGTASDGELAVEVYWPWGPELFKPTPADSVRQLTKVGALVAAEIDRLLAEPSGRETPGGR